MNRKLVTPLVVVGALVIGIAIGGIGVWKLNQPKLSDSWLAVSPNPTDLPTYLDSKSDHPKVAYSISESVVQPNDSFPIPDVTAVTGKVKFIPNRVTSAPGKMALGYVMEVSIARTNWNNVSPDNGMLKMLKGTAEANWPNAVYEVYFDFDLLDKDGFLLQKLQSPKCYVVAGEPKTAQDRIDDVIDRKVAIDTMRIEYTLRIQRVASDKPRRLGCDSKL